VESRGGRLLWLGRWGDDLEEALHLPLAGLRHAAAAGDGEQQELSVGCLLLQMMDEVLVADRRLPGSGEDPLRVHLLHFQSPVDLSDGLVLAEKRNFIGAIAHHPAPVPHEPSARTSALGPPGIVWEGHGLSEIPIGCGRGGDSR